MNSAQNKFDSLVTNDFSKASLEDVKVVALAIWHENFIPAVDHLDDQAVNAAGYIVDKLMRFNCVAKELKDKLRSLLTKLRKTCNIVPVFVKGCDKLAQEWGLQNDLKQHVRNLLSYQTRHYVHNCSTDKKSTNLLIS